MSSAKPMTTKRRMENYRAQNGTRGEYTTPQWRQIHKGAIRASARRRKEKENA